MPRTKESGNRELTRDEKLTLPYREQVKSLNERVAELVAELDALREAGRAVVDTGVEVEDGVEIELAPLLALRDLVGGHPK